MVALAAASAAGAQGAAPDTFEARLNSLNNSGVTGSAFVALDSSNDELTVIIAAEGLEANQTHPQHIHGNDNASENATCPTLAQDSNSGDENDNQISVAEGRETYGPIILALEPFPTADNNGNVTYRQTFQLGEGDTPSVAQLQPLENRHIVLHGLTVGGQYIATRPVTCGQLIPRPQQDGQ
ncbi:MAG: CHRD domain-containing protein [Salinisphaeraceae bacterium]|uniref:CHRD domain-containing protein n=1 Tax=Spectribacter hydrogenoxidans TaxID=3075608 RepID=A0ABU3C3K7_9GAMM|nr:CHRD domain-containing protein [Salinisphaera sp. W335]MDT0635929.1 CHRD domain-containing protein [Salinisphaera sp. W335]